MSDKMVVAYVCDEGYEDLCRISMASVRRYNKNVEFAVLSNDRSLTAFDTRVFPIDVSFAKDMFKFKEDDRMKAGVYYKFWLATLPYDKVLYLDCDTICQRPLNELWNMDCPFICATESHRFGKEQAAALGIKQYALTGMMLMNLKALRRENFLSRCLDRLRVEHPDQHDETIINEEFGDKIKFIDKKYNYCRHRRYDNPIPESDAYILHYVGQANKRAMLKINNFSNLTALKALFRNKTVAIVGNSSAILKSNFRLDVDSHDVVIRFNKGFWWLHPEQVGTKTTALFLACTISEEELEKYQAKYVIARSKACENICDFKLAGTDRSTLAQEANEAVMEREISDFSQASTGFIAINFALSCRCKSIDLYGFDFMRTHTYYNDPNKIVLHNGEKEAEKVLEYEKYGLLKIHGYEPEKKEEIPNPKWLDTNMNVLEINEEVIDFVADRGAYAHGDGNIPFEMLDYESKLNLRLVAYRCLKAYQRYVLEKRLARALEERDHARNK